MKHCPEDSKSLAGMVEVDSHYITLMPKKGIGQVEQTENLDYTWTWNDMVSTYTITNYSDVVCDAELKFNLSSASKEPAEVSVYLNDTLLDNVDVVAGNFTSCSYRLKLLKGTTNDLKFIYRGEIVGPTESDSRSLALMVKGIEVVKAR